MSTSGSPPFCNGGPLPGAVAWHLSDAELARWAWDRYVVRTDVWGGYNPLDQRKKKVKRQDGSEFELGPTTTRPWKKNRGKELLTLDTLAQHFRATAPEHIVGIHTTSPENLCMFGSAEIDHHGEKSTHASITWKAAEAWYSRLVLEGFHPLLTDSNGNGGYHLDVLSATAIPSEQMFWFMKHLVCDHAKFGMDKPPEVFPKQPRLATPEEIKAAEASGKRRSRYGNWLRLPGLHHTRSHWSRVWNGSRWLDGHEAVAFVLQIRGDSPSLFKPVAEYRAAVYMAKLPRLCEGQGRDDVAYRFGAFLVRDLRLPDAEAVKWLNKWDAGNSPPKGEERLREIVANAHSYGRQDYANATAEAPAASPPPQRGFRFEPINSKQLEEADLTPRWLVQKVLVAGQNCIVGAPKKCLKTSTSIDLAISLATGTPWLGQFACPTPERVVLLSGESGEFTIRETARRVCLHKGLELATVDVHWLFRLPRLALAAEIDELRRGLLALGATVCIIDPLYLCLLAGSEAKASNLFDMGPLLLAVGDACKSAGCTPILLHHTSKPSQTKYEDPPELEDLAFAGIPEFARQWILFKRRMRYEPGSGLHQLWLAVGGSVGHGGLWGLDVDEGVLNESFGGRHWKPTILSAAEARQEVRSGKETSQDARQTSKKERQHKDNEAKFMAAFEKLSSQLGPDGKPLGWAGTRKVRDKARLSSTMADRVLAGLIEEGILEEFDHSLEKPNPRNPKKTIVSAFKALRRPVAATTGTNGTSGTESLFSQSSPVV
ncbi:MAG: AAA family ATPase [Gemmataceae bacterium]|nr:AAA family ATPase [Gemmataceae bacterium]